MLSIRRLAIPFTIVLPGIAATLMITLAAARAQPAPAHVMVIVMENQSYDNARSTPYVASLVANSASFSNSHGIWHPSQPNYFVLWCGAMQAESGDNCPADGIPYYAENLGHASEVAGLRWRAYSENLPSIAATTCITHPGQLYLRKHCPWTNWGNVDHMNERPYTDLAVDIANDSLPQLAFVIPNACHDTHDCPIQAGDDWLSQNVPAMLSAIGPRGLLILTWDEDDYSGDNRILTVFAGPLVKPGYVSGRIITHYTVLRTICEYLGLEPMGQSAADSSITDVWSIPIGVPPAAPAAATLSPVRPNPSSGRLSTMLSVPGPTTIDAAVFDLAGRRVRTILSGVRGGATKLEWDGRDELGHRVAAGLYVLRARAGELSLERKITRVD